MSLHEPLRKLLAAFEAGTRSCWTDDRDMMEFGILTEIINDTLNQRIFRTDYDQLDILAENQTSNGGEVGWTDTDIAAMRGCSGIARCDKQVFATGTRRQTAGEGMFASP